MAILEFVVWHFIENPIGTSANGRSWTMADYHSIDFQEILYRSRMSLDYADIFLGWSTLGIYNVIRDNKQYYPNIAGYLLK